MAWQLDQFLAEKVERGRKLLAESEEHRGSTDLQVRVGAPRGVEWQRHPLAGCQIMPVAFQAPHSPSV